MESRRAEWYLPAGELSLMQGLDDGREELMVPPTKYQNEEKGLCKIYIQMHLLRHLGNFGRLLDGCFALQVSTKGIATSLPFTPRWLNPVETNLLALQSIQVRHDIITIGEATNLSSKVFSLPLLNRHVRLEVIKVF